MIVMIDFEVCLGVLTLRLLYVFLLYYLWNLFVFADKDIDWRLPSMKLVVSVMLYWIPSQPSLYIAPCCRALWSWFIHICTLIHTLLLQSRALSKTSHHGDIQYYILKEKHTNSVWKRVQVEVYHESGKFFKKNALESVSIPCESKI